jgi:protein O-GlcNAc transferase
VVRLEMVKKNKTFKHGRGHLKKRKQVLDPHGGYLQQALALHQAGRLPEAEALYRQILLAEPAHPEALHFLGLLAHQLGKSAVAVELMRKAIDCRPDYVLAHNNLGNALQALGRLDEAAASFRRALHCKPDYVEAHYNLGVVLQAQGKLDEATASYRRALSLRPDYVEAHYNLGFILQAQGKLDGAIASFRQALVYRPDYVEAHYNLGVLLQEKGTLEEAVACYHQALALRPDHAAGHNNLGIVLGKQGKPDEAIASFRTALSYKPDYVEAHCNLGNALKDQGKLDEAVASYRVALRMKPDDLVVHSNLLLCLNYDRNRSISHYLDEARNYGRYAAGKVSERFMTWSCSAKPERLRIGIVSGDLRNHSVGYFLEGLLTHIDPTRVELVAYPTFHQEEELTIRIRPLFASWKPLPLFWMGDADAARLIHDDGVHVLLDLSGHTNHNRLPVFAWKPAPVQVSWLGYSASTGLEEMDYLLADPYVVPPGEEAHFTETIWRLPESYLCFAPPQVTMAVSSLPALDNGLLTFGCFNNPAKMNDSVVTLWAKVLRAVPGAHLFLKAKQFSDPARCEATRRRFTAFGIASERLLFEGYVSSREGHLAAYNRVDIALDPFPYNGTTTSVEGLWMGVPFITLRGDRFVSHVGESIAHNTGMADWIASDDEDYVAKARAQTADLEKLTRLRAGLRQQVLASPVFDGPRFARHFEEALWEMWHRFQAAYGHD